MLYTLNVHPETLAAMLQVSGFGPVENISFVSAEQSNQEVDTHFCH